MLIVNDAILPPCASAHGVYLDELLHSPPSRSEMTRAEREQMSLMRAAAHRQCAGCPLLIECLYRAVVEVDVSGFAACTTEHDRQHIRRELGVVVAQPAPASAFGSPRTGAGPVSHEAVLTIRQAYPHDTCQQLANRLGCSTSTVKRHLRRARESQPDQSVSVGRGTPTVDQVLDVFDQLESSRVA